MEDFTENLEQMSLLFSRFQRCSVILDYALSSIETQIDYVHHDVGVQAGPPVDYTRMKFNKIIIVNEHVISPPVRLVVIFTLAINPCYLYVSVTHTDELILTGGGNNHIIIMDRNGQQLTSVDTGSVCGRCVSDKDNNLYVCHPSKPDPCVTVLRQ
jgi:hypothetical protein